MDLLTDMLVKNKEVSTSISRWTVTRKLNGEVNYTSAILGEADQRLLSDGIMK